MVMNAFDSSERCLKPAVRGTIAEEKHKASWLLIDRKFEQCIDVCHNALNLLKNNDNGCDDDGRKKEQSATVTTTRTIVTNVNHVFSVVEKASDVEEFLVILAQALAEQERWQEVLPYITDMYSGVENLPPNILKLCLLLHANVAEYSTCSAIFNVWRTSEERQVADNNLEMLMDIYVSHVLLPSGNASQLTSFIMSSNLDQSVKERLLAKYAEQGRVVDSAMVDSVDGISTAEESQLELPHRVIGGVVGKAVKLLTVMLQWFKSLRLTNRSKVVASMAGLAALLLIIRNSIDYGNNNHYQYLFNLLRYFLFARNVKHQ